MIAIFQDLFYKRLIQFRMSKGVSAREMSLALGQSSGYINKIENRKSLPSMDQFFNICDYFHVTPKEFFDDGYTYHTDLQEAVHALQELSPEYLATITVLAKGLKK